MSSKKVLTIAVGLLIASVAMTGYAGCKGKKIKIHNEWSKDVYYNIEMAPGDEKYLEKPVTGVVKAGKTIKDGKFLGPKSSTKRKYIITLNEKLSDGSKGESCEYVGKIKTDSFWGTCVNEKVSNSCDEKPYAKVDSGANFYFDLYIKKEKSSGPIVA